MAAARAGSGDVSVGQKLLGLGVVVLVRLARFKYAFVVECFEKIRCDFVVGLAAGAGIVVKSDSKVRKRVAHHKMVAVYNFARTHSLFARLHGNGHSVLVGTADEGDLFAF